MNKELEEAVEILKNMDIEISGISTCKKCIFDSNKSCYENGVDCQMKAIETVLNYIENSIPKKKVEEKIEYVEKEGYWNFTTDRDSDKAVEILQELLEGK